MNDYDRKNLEGFFNAIGPNIGSYKYACFSYLALKQENEFHLVQGQLQLQVISPIKTSGSFQSENIMAGIFPIKEAGHHPREFANALFSGKIKTPHGEIQFLPGPDRPHSTYFNPYFFDNTSTQRRQIRLGITGNQRIRTTDSPTLDWELKAAPTPFFNVQELCDEFFVGAIRGDSSSVEITAFPIAAISPESVVDGTKARIAIELADSLPRESATIGYRIFGRNQGIKRGILNSASLSWSNRTDVWCGIGEIEVPPGAIVDCIASIAGIAQQHHWINDPKIAQNPRRSVHEAFDGGLGVLRELIEKSQKKGVDARELEMAVSWLLWLLGFSATHIGGTGKTSDAPDLIAATPLGNLIVIECTTGILKEDSKLPHLCQRTEKIRQSLTNSGNQHVRVLPMLVTTKSRDEVKSELEQANKLGVLVATKEDFNEIISRTAFLPNPDRLYLEGEESLRHLQNTSQFNLAI